MAATATTQVPPNQGAGFPPFKTQTFPSQIFWLAITFGFLFVVLWRVAGPRMNRAISSRRETINKAISDAARAKGDAETAETAYNLALAGARARAQSLADEVHRGLNAEIAKAKAQADSEAAAAMAAADARITATHAEARGHVANAACEAAIAIVERLTGEKVSAAEAATVVGA